MDVPRIMAAKTIHSHKVKVLPKITHTEYDTKSFPVLTHTSYLQYE